MTMADTSALVAEVNRATKELRDEMELVLEHRARLDPSQHAMQDALIEAELRRVDLAYLLECTERMLQLQDRLPPDIRRALVELHRECKAAAVWLSSPQVPTQ
jgi:hypothetical protein